MGSPSELFYALYCQKVGTYAFNLCSHFYQHSAQLLNIWFTSGVIDCRRAFGQRRGHYQVGRPGYRSLIEKHIRPCQSLGCLDFIYLMFLHIFKIGPELLQSKKMRVETAPAYFVASRLWKYRFAETRHQRPYDHHRPAERTRLFEEFLRVYIAYVNIVGSEPTGVMGRKLHLDPHIAQHPDEVAHV